MTTPSGSRTDAAQQADRSAWLRDRGEHDASLCFWYQATRVARAEASCRYRMGNFAEQLRGATTLIASRPLPRLFEGRAVVVVLRPLLDTWARGVVARLRAQGTRVVADFDDLLFSGDPAEYPLVLSGAMSRSEWAERLVQYRAGLADFDGFTVATEPLREYLRAAVPGAEVRVVPNGVSPLWVRQGRALYPGWQPGDPKVIRFLPGSPSHDANFESIAPALAHFMGNHPEVRLEIVGPLRWAERAFPEQRVSHVGRVPYSELPRLLASSWVTLAPLTPTEFNRCRSGLKFLESAAFGTPCVASPTADMERHVEGGVQLARSESDWKDVLESLLDDRRRMQLGRQGREYVEAKGTAAVGAQVLLDGCEPWKRPA